MQEPGILNKNLTKASSKNNCFSEIVFLSKEWLLMKKVRDILKWGKVLILLIRFLFFQIS